MSQVPLPAVLYMKPIVSVFVVVVVVGSARSLDARHFDPLQVSARAAVPVALIISFWPLTGVPLGLLMVVAATVCPVIS